jgi:hypothetical protein
MTLVKKKRKRKANEDGTHNKKQHHVYKTHPNPGNSVTSETTTKNYDRKKEMCTCLKDRCIVGIHGSVKQ